MLAPSVLYALLRPWLQALGVAGSSQTVDAVAHLFTALLVGQSLRASCLMRASLSRHAIPARQAYRRVARAWDRPWLAPARLVPVLVGAVVALCAPDPTQPLLLGLDSVRCGRWEVFTIGVVWHGRVLLVGWSVLPYPWPKKTFTPTVCALIRLVAAALPAGRPAELLADRAFPSRPFFRTLRGVGWDWTIRLQSQHGVTVRGQAQRVRALLEAGMLGQWRHWAGTFGSGADAVAGTIVVGRGLVVLPAHQRTEGSLRHRAAQAAKRQRHVTSKHKGRRDASAETDHWVVLFTSHAHWGTATAHYRQRWATEGTYRDGQGGWDGRHGWDLEHTLQRVRLAERVERVVGLWALGTLVQTWVGGELLAAPPAIRAITREWTTTGRLSVWAVGRFALTERSGRLVDWLTMTLECGAQRLAHPAAAPPTRGATRSAAAHRGPVPTPAEAGPDERDEDLPWAA